MSPRKRQRPRAARDPMGFVRPKDGREVLARCLDAARYWADGLEVSGQCRIIGPLDFDLVLSHRLPLSDQHRCAFVANCEGGALSPSSWLCRFPWHGYTWELVGFDPRRRANPVAARQLPSGMSAWLPIEALWSVAQSAHLAIDSGNV